MDFERKRKISTSDDYQLDPESKQKTKRLFEKKCTYKKAAEWKLPPLSGDQYSKWTNDELMILKDKLNRMKDTLSDKDICSWHDHTQFMNTAGTVVNTVRQQIHPELCTQAWCKFYEILSCYPLVNFSLETLNTVHLCEAPGAFVTCLNHYLISNDFSGMWTWLGNTLNPYYEGNNLEHMIDDDRFIRGSMDYWYFGGDNTGDMMNIDNLNGLLEVTSSMGDIRMVTADGSIDCQDDPAEQELIVSRLHYCETLAAIMMLSVGGCFVLKKFTMFESETISLLFMLCCLFEKVNVFKPATSKSGNSEVYVVCIDFKGLEGRIQEFKEFSNNFFKNADLLGVNFPMSCLPLDFISEHIKICQTFTDWQMETILNNINHYPNKSEQYSGWMESVKEFCAEFYISHYNVQTIHPRDRIVPYRKSKRKVNCFHHSTRQSFRSSMKKYTGTYNDRQKYVKLPWIQQIKEAEEYSLHKWKVKWLAQKAEECVKIMDKWNLATGKTVSVINSSRFCAGSLVYQFNKLQEYQKISGKDSHQLDFTEVLDDACLALYLECKKPVSLLIETVLRDRINEDKLIRLKHVNQVSTGDAEDHLMTASVYQRYDTEDHVMATSVYLGFHTSELESQQCLLENAIKILQNVKTGHSAILLLSTSLLRVTAGVILLLSFCFEKVAFVPGRIFHFAMVCWNSISTKTVFLQYLKKMDLNGVLEVVPIYEIFNDEDFTNQIHEVNEYVIKSTVNHIMKENTSSGKTGIVKKTPVDVT